MMNNAQMFWDYVGKDSSGTHMEAAKKLVAAAAEKYFTLRGSRCADERVNAAWFAMMAASPALVYDVGEIVQVVRNGVPHYGVVAGYSASEHGYTGIKVDNSSDPMVHGYWSVEPTDPGKYRLHLPKELVDVMRTQLAASCPLKEAACGR